MTFTSFIKAIVVLTVSVAMYSVSANSVGLEQVEYDGNFDQVSITLVYDFTDFSMFGGGLDIIYDANSIEFVSYTQQDPLPFDAQAPASPVGELTAPGLYSGAGIGTFEFFNGMNSAGNIGTFVFNIVGPTDAGATPCGFALCLAPNAINPFVSLAGDIVTDELIANGFNGTLGVPIPVPAAVWLMLSGVGALVGFGRKTV